MLCEKNLREWLRDAPLNAIVERIETAESAGQAPLA